MRLRLPRRELSAHRVYLLLAGGTAFLVGIAYATTTVYWVTSGRLNALQLVLLGTGLEFSYFVFQLPTGVLADVVGRRLCVLAGLFLMGLALVVEGTSASFANLFSVQFLLGLGYALNNGAQEAWIADELAATEEPGGPQMTGVYLRATQLGLAATVAGSLLSGPIAAGGLNLPLITSGSLLCALAAASALVMPEHNFQRGTKVAGGVRAIVRQSREHLAAQTRATHRAIVVVPGLVLLFAMTFFVGLWSESFDRLWGALLIRTIGIPKLAGLSPAMWFSLLAAAVAVLALGSTEFARRRAGRLGSHSVASALLTLTTGIAAGVIALATTRSFAVAVAAYLLIETLRPVMNPLVNGWMVTRIDSSVRATALSARDMFDSGGQMLGGPVVGVIGTLTSIRIALLAGAAALVPALACLGISGRRIRPRAALATVPPGDDGGPAEGAATATAGPGLP